MESMYLVLGVYGGVPDGGTVWCGLDDAITCARNLLEDADSDDDVVIYQFELRPGAELVEVNAWQRDSRFAGAEE